LRQAIGLPSRFRGPMLMSRLLLVLGACSLGLPCLTPSAGAEEAQVKIGAVVKGLSFKDIRYLTRTLDDLPGGKAYVLVFTNTTCPLVRRYLPALNKLEKAYRKKGVRFLAVNASPEDSIRAMAAQAVEHDVEFPAVKDHDARCARALGVKYTPEVAVLDASRKLRFRGRIDDQYRIGGTRAKATRHDLKEALEAILAGKPVAVPETSVDGCPITRTELATPKTPITFTEHVAPLVKKHCADCHRPNTAAPFSLLTYGQVAGKANAIAEVVRDERMPPWYGAPGKGEFVNHRGLSAKERETVLLWVKGGKKKGDEAKMPKMPGANTDRWRIGKPDLILRAPAHEVPEEGVIDYKYAVLPFVFLQDTWVQAVQILPDNPKVLHHCNMAYYRLGEKWSKTNFITGVVPGSDPMMLEDGVAYRIRAGSVLALEIHYVPTGKKEKCRISVGIKYASGRIDKNLRFFLLEDKTFVIPPGAPAHKASASRTLTHDAEGLGLFCHMHLRGRDMTFKAHYPGGRSETLLLIPNYNFDWQTPYRWAPGKKKFPKGTRLEAVARYDNSAFNPFNPDPKATVRDGLQTFHEMMNGFVFFVDANEKLGLDIDGKTGRAKAKGREGRKESR
jgi:thiol-disulfide isomerase/thioredoxin